MMTPEQLRALIENDAEALSLAQSGAADQCAKRCMAIAPKVAIETRVGDINIVGLFANPADGEAVCQQIEAVAATNPIVKRAWRWAAPGAPGIDIGNATVRQMLVATIEQGGCGLTPEQMAPIIAASSVAPVITGADVSTAFPFEAE